jgi:predicted nucleic acid-binding protein
VNGTELALDTNAAIGLLNDAHGMAGWIRDADRLLLPVPVVGELRFGALNSSRPEENLTRVQALTDRCGVLASTSTTAEVYA